MGSNVFLFEFVMCLSRPNKVILKKFSKITKIMCYTRNEKKKIHQFFH